MEGVGCEAASLAGHLQLSNLCWIYDDNHITIEGHTDLAFSENVAERFQALGWNTAVVEDANDLEQIDRAHRKFELTADRPTLIILRSIIGWGSPNKANTHDAHGSPLGEEEVRLTKEVYGWPNELFAVPHDVVEHFREAISSRVAGRYAEWQQALERFAGATRGRRGSRSYPGGTLPAGWENAMPSF